MNKQPNDDNTIKYYLIFATIVFLAMSAQVAYSDYLKAVGQ